MPAPHSLVQHDALAQLQTQLEDEEIVFAFLDVAYLIVQRGRTRHYE